MIIDYKPEYKTITFTKDALLMVLLGYEKLSNLEGWKIDRVEAFDNLIHITFENVLKIS